MRKLLIPLLSAIALPTAVNADIDSKEAEFCLEAADFAGCFKAMTINKPIEEGEVTRKMIRNDGSLTLFNPEALLAKKINGEYGRYITFRYFRQVKGRKYERTVEADCQDYTANWENDDRGWLNLRSKKWSRKEATQEVKNILDEFCPQMDQLVKTMKEGSNNYFEYPKANEIYGSDKGSRGGGNMTNKTEGLLREAYLENELNFQRVRSFNEQRLY